MLVMSSCIFFTIDKLWNVFIFYKLQRIYVTDNVLLVMGFVLTVKH